MNDVCKFIKDYIKSDSIERKQSLILFDKDDELQFSTISEEHKYVIECLKKIEEVSAITNIREGPGYTHLADLVITDNKTVKTSIFVYTDTYSMIAYDYWVVEVEAIISNT